MKLIRRKPVHAAETFLVAVRKVEQGCVSENGHAPIAEPIMIATSTPRSTFSRLFAARRPCHNVAYGPRAIVFMPGMNTSPSSRNPRPLGRGRMSTSHCRQCSHAHSKSSSHCHACHRVSTHWCGPSCPMGNTQPWWSTKEGSPSSPIMVPQMDGIIRPVPEYPPPRSDHFSNGP